MNIGVSTLKHWHPEFLAPTKTLIGLQASGSIKTGVLNAGRAQQDYIQQRSHSTVVTTQTRSNNAASGRTKLVSFAAISQEKLFRLLGICTFWAAAVLTGEGVPALRQVLIPSNILQGQTENGIRLFACHVMPMLTFREGTDAECNAQVLHCMLRVHSSQLSGSVRACC